MKYTHQYVIFLIVTFLAGCLSVISAQEKSPLTNSVLNFEGTGFHPGTKMLRLSGASLQRTDNKRASLNDKGIVVGESGLYQISFSGNMRENDNFEQKEEYVVYINGTEVMKGYEVPSPPTGVLSFQKELKKGDILSIGTTADDKDLKSMAGINMLSMRLLKN
ncbi:uncharacterized protein CHSO_1968 [Chryseobacterium sp. StRB126]|uniref:hypothetical protein n=1 Tax=Chryseobacterium sp. StRB126 TaxID=878220 RepID=UPI0004E98706|nr:hypothetical protein [Chryseobacterium sp. StRB126]BAP31005.1 uncharacterized protein CHSO_1968 [Chryseobacterium sp. StRB126]